jgi:hypothetical protein
MATSSPLHGTGGLNFDGILVYTPDAGYSGTDRFTYNAVNSGIVPVEESETTVFLVVGTLPPPLPNGNYAPIVDAIATRNDVEGRTINVQVFAVDPDLHALTYTSPALPPGLTINANTGIISGKIAYTSARSYNVTVNVTDTLGASTGISFVWNVADATIGTLKGTEIYNGTLLPNAFTVDGIWGGDGIYLSPGNTLRLEVAAPPAGYLPEYSDALFLITGSWSDPRSGDFSAEDWPVIAFGGPSVTSTIKAGTDLNGNATLDPTEVTHEFVVQRINFTGSKVQSRRVAGGTGPVEPGFTDVKYAEHFEIGGNFMFHIAGGASGPFGMIRYEVWDLDGIDDLLVSGSGWSFSYIFEAGTAEGDCLVRFYADRNNNQSRDSGELYFDSLDFWVMEKKVYNLVADVSSAILAPAFAGRLTAGNGIFAQANAILLRKDSETDYRAAVQFNVTTTPFTPTAVGGARRPDPVPIVRVNGEVQNSVDLDNHFNATADIVFVNNLNV